MRQIKIFNDDSPDALQNNINGWIGFKIRECDEVNYRTTLGEYYFEVVQTVYGLHARTGGELFLYHCVVMYDEGYRKN